MGLTLKRMLLVLFFIVFFYAFTEDIFESINLTAIISGVLWLVNERKQKNKVLAHLPEAGRVKERKLEIKKFFLVLGMIVLIFFLMLCMIYVVKKYQLAPWFLDVFLPIIFGAFLFVLHKLSNKMK